MEKNSKELNDESHYNSDSISDKFRPSTYPRSIVSDERVYRCILAIRNQPVKLFSRGYNLPGI